MNERVVVISGATGRLGNVVAKAFGADGHYLALLGRDKFRLDNLVNTLGLAEAHTLPLSVDLKDAKAASLSAESVRARFGSIHVLIHLIGGWTGGKTLIETDPADYKNMLDQHALTTFNLIQAYVPHILASGWGRVLVVSTPSAVQPPGKNGVYAASKAYMESLILTLAEELKNSSITANILQVRSIDADHAGTGTTPEEITASINFLCSPEAGRISGARLPLFGVRAG